MTDFSGTIILGHPVTARSISLNALHPAFWLSLAASSVLLRYKADRKGLRIGSSRARR
jgi:hypothetical protein